MAKLDIGRSNAAADENDLEICLHSPNAFGPTSGRSAVLGRNALEVSRATAIKPDRRLYDQCQFWSQIS
jgi:hypothetical protein